MSSPTTVEVILQPVFLFTSPTLFYMTHTQIKLNLISKAINYVSTSIKMRLGLWSSLYRVRKSALHVWGFLLKE